MYKPNTQIYFIISIFNVIIFLLFHILNLHGILTNFMDIKIQEVQSLHTKYLINL